METTSGHRDNRRFVAWLALSLFVFGIALPLAMSLIGQPVFAEAQNLQLFVFLSPTAEFLAIALGFLGRRYLSGRIAFNGALVLLATVLLCGLFR